jgi:FMN phosphatase YigB (HAD superfamily)
MTNGSAAITRGCLQRAGLEPYIVDVMDIAMVQRWKPHASVYTRAAKQLGLPPEQVNTCAQSPSSPPGMRRIKADLHACGR